MAEIRWDAFARSWGRVREIRSGTWGWVRQIAYHATEARLAVLKDAFDYQPRLLLHQGGASTGLLGIAAQHRVDHLLPRRRVQRQPTLRHLALGDRHGALLKLLAETTVDAQHVQHDPLVPLCRVELAVVGRRAPRHHVPLFELGTPLGDQPKGEDHVAVQQHVLVLARRLQPAGTTGA